MAIVDAVTRRTYVATPKRGPITRLLEDERWLASTLLLPTIALLGLFIAYPFVKGVDTNSATHAIANSQVQVVRQSGRTSQRIIAGKTSSAHS